MRSLLHGRSHASAHTRGHTLGSPRLYDIIANVAFHGRRSATYQALIAAAGVQPGQRVLDIGCGTGYFARLLCRAVGPRGLVIGIDASRDMIDYANRTRATANCEFQVATAEALPFPAEHFDVVVSSLMLHHLPDDLRVAVLQEARRVLRTAGTLLVVEAQSTARQGVGWRLPGVHHFDRMARRVPGLEPIAVQAGFDEVRSGEAAPLLRYIVAVKRAA
jgi:ubiquinone/menaquinone biosynthesis C-methylase UbiE